jgi:putative addiction module CopG family antidote
MTVTLPPELDSIIVAKMKSGRYRSAEELVADAVCNYQTEEEKIAWLRAEIQKGLNSPIIDQDFSMDELLEEIEHEASEGRAA